MQYKSEWIEVQQKWLQSLIRKGVWCIYTNKTNNNMYLITTSKTMIRSSIKGVDLRTQHNNEVQ